MKLIKNKFLIMVIFPLRHDLVIMSNIPLNKCDSHHGMLSATVYTWTNVILTIMVHPNQSCIHYHVLGMK